MRVALLFILVLVYSGFSQCPPSTITTTITGLYTVDIIPSQGSTVYITPSATVTGNISLFNCSLYNCGIIKCSSIRMKQNSTNSQYIFNNNGKIECDSLILDSLGHIHNNDTLLCNKFINLKYNSILSNSYLIDIIRGIVETGSDLQSQGTIKANYLTFKDSNSQFYNSYGNLSVRKLLHFDTGTIASGVIFICVDSCLINNGFIGSQTATTWTPSIKVLGKSQNTGTISTIDFCDYSTTTGGQPDLNSGSMQNITYCSPAQSFCDYTYSDIKKIRSNAHISIYPNPFDNSIFFNTGSAIFSMDCIFTLRNVYGVEVSNQIINRDINSINLDHLPRGVYFADMFKNGQSVYRTKLIKQE